MNPTHTEVDRLSPLPGARLDATLARSETARNENAAAKPDANCADPPILTGSERERLLVEWNATEAPIPNCRVHQLFEIQADNTPNAVAIDDGERRLTYRDLAFQSDRLARALRAQGVVAETLVGIFLERSIESVVAVLGIWKVGAAYVPLDPRLPKQRLAFVIEDTTVRTVVTDSRMPTESLSAREEIVFVDVSCVDFNGVEINGDVKDEASSAENDTAGGDQLAYVLHTSGSTGMPKGVAITHRNTVNLLCAVQHLTGFAHTDVMLALTTLTFDISVLEMMLPLISGGIVRIVSPDDAVDGRRLRDVIERSNVSYVQATPALWRMLVQTGWSGSANITGISGGEPLPRDLADSLLDRLRVLWNMYGPTETTVYSTAGQVRRGTAIDVGRPLANTRALILDSALQPLPVGVEGDLYLGGEGVARGYWNRPELTAERFLRDPFSSDPQARIYFTGDRARFCPDGEIDLIGRSDRQVKLRGFRIELGEIECTLVQHPAVANAAVVAHADESGDLRLVCFFASLADQQANTRSLREHLRNRLPEYMVPTVFVELPALPLTPGGKIDRKALPELDERMASLQRDYAAPRDALETGLAVIWGRILQVDKVGVRDHFFDLGGHSIQAVRMLAEVERAFGHAPALRSVFERPTLAEVATAIRERQEHQAHPIVRPLGGAAAKSIDHSRPPLIVAPSLFGETGDWRQVFAQSSGGRPVIGIEIEGNEPYWSEAPSLEEIAARCIASIREEVLKKPFHLAGFSFGAWLVYEMACQLERAGNPPRSVTIVDSCWTGTPRSWTHRLFLDLPSIIGNAPRWLAEHADLTILRRLAKRVCRQTWRLLTSGKSQGSESGDRLADALRRADPMFDLKRLPELYRRRLVLGIRAQAAYQPGNYSGRLAYLECQVRSLIHRNVRDGGWGALARGSLEIHRIPHSHRTAMDGTDPQLRTVLLDVMERTDAESRTA